VSFVKDGPGGALLEVLVVPRASRTEAKGEYGGRLKIALAAPPVDGAANAALVRFLSEALSVRGSEVEIVRGARGRRKTVRLAGQSALEVARAFAALDPPAP